MPKFASTLVIAALACFGSACDQQPQRAVTAEKTPGAPAQAPALTEHKFRSGMLIEDVKNVVYRDENGADISFDKFVSAVTGGRSFKKEVEADKSVAVMTINPVEAAPNVERHKNAALSIPVASEMPPLKHADISGKLYALNNGKHYTLLSFFFAECVPCIQEIPQLNALQERGKKLQLISVTFDDRATARRFVSERGLKLPVVADAQAYIDALGVKTFPTLVLISPEGRLVGARTSYKTASTLEAGLRELEDWLSSFGLQTEALAAVGEPA